VNHDPLCTNTPEHYDGSILWPARCDCDIIAAARADERQRIVAGIGRWCEQDAVIQSYGPDDIWGYAYGVRYTATRIARGDFAAARGEAS